MYIKTQIQNLLAQISALLESLANEQYTQPVRVLSDATIGQHTRHIMEFYLELFKGYDQGVIDYDNRKRSQAIESDRLVASQQLREIAEKLAKPNKELWLTADFGELEESVVSLTVFICSSLLTYIFRFQVLSIFGIRPKTA
jgi:hypothetical protein